MSKTFTSTYFTCNLSSSISAAYAFNLIINSLHPLSSTTCVTGHPILHTQKIWPQCTPLICLHIFQGAVAMFLPCLWYFLWSPHLKVTYLPSSQNFDFMHLSHILFHPYILEHISTGKKDSSVQGHSPLCVFYQSYDNDFTKAEV